MKIARVKAIPLDVPVRIRVLGLDKPTSLSVCLVEVETDAGLVGHGFTAITEEEVVAATINEVAGPAIVGDDPLAHERVWEKLYWLLSPRGQTGYASHAIAAIDVALWDLKGKHFGAPVWRLLGGARNRVPVYATFGFGFFDRDQLAEAAKLWVGQGHTRLKMVVGHHALQRRDEPRPLDRVIAADGRRPPDRARGPGLRSRLLASRRLQAARDRERQVSGAIRRDPRARAAAHLAGQGLTPSPIVHPSGKRYLMHPMRSAVLSFSVPARRARTTVSLVLAAAGIAACAPDSVRPDPGFDGWTNRIIQECYPRSIGGAQLTPLFNDPSFLDSASRLYFRKSDVQQFTGFVNGFYPGDNKAAIDCIASKLPPQVSPTMR